MNHTKIASLVALAAIVAAPLAATAQTRPYGNDRYDNGVYNDGYGSRNVTGTVASANSGDITLSNGRTIFLKHGTVIDPRGQSLQAGQRIAVRGVDAGNGNLNAQSIQILGNARYGTGYNNSYNNDDTNRRRRDRDDGNRGYGNRDNRDNRDDRDRRDANDNRDRRDNNGNRDRGDKSDTRDHRDNNDNRDNH